MSILWDCYPKRLRTIALRNLKSYPSTLHLSLNTPDNSYTLQKSHIFTSNPTWRQLDIPGSIFPLLLKVTNESNEILYECELNSSEMYFICEQLEDLDPFNFPALLLEFNHEAFYTTLFHAEDLTKLAANCDKLLKYQSTSDAKAREILYSEAKEKYSELFNYRQKLSDISEDILKIKAELVNLFPSKKFHYLNYKKSKELKKSCKEHEEVIAKQENMIRDYKKLISDKTGQKKVYDELLKAHRKKKTERMEKCIKEKELVISKERLLKARRIKMLRELLEALRHKELFRYQDFGKRIPYTSENEEEINFSFGYMAHAMDILNDIFKTPSIYQVKFLGSRSSIVYQGKELLLYLTQGSKEIPGAEHVKNDCEKHLSKNETE